MRVKITKQELSETYVFHDGNNDSWYLFEPSTRRYNTIDTGGSGQSPNYAFLDVYSYSLRVI